MVRRDLKLFEGSLDLGLGQFWASIRNQNFNDFGIRDRDFDLKKEEYEISYGKAGQESLKDQLQYFNTTTCL